jgi:hypothetical protein
MFTHELAHLAVGSAIGLVPIEVSFGKGREIYRCTLGGLRFRLRWLLWGGYIKFSWRSNKRWKNIATLAAGPVSDLFWIWVVLEITNPNWLTGFILTAIMFRSQSNDWKKIVDEINHQHTYTITVRDN